MNPPDPQEWQLATRRLGRRVLVYDHVASTSDLALAFAGDPAHDGLVVMAREQSAGRGQHGRTWQAPPGSSVLMSLLLFPPAPLCRAPLLTAWAAVSVSQLILELTGLETWIKWPNDVYLGDKKVCGILIEQRSRGPHHPPATVVGIGLNVLQPAEFFARAELPLGGSLLSQSGREFAPDEVARRLVARLDDQYHRLLDGDLEGLQSSWQARLGLMGAQVTVTTMQASHHGRLIELSFDALTLLPAAAQPLRLAPETVRQITPSPSPTK
jgi:BirA family biotin operon repressor/biotin-[acetyl-CoA-carboxylase] ligase